MFAWKHMVFLGILGNSEKGIDQTKYASDKKLQLQGWIMGMTALGLSLFNKN